MSKVQESKQSLSFLDEIEEILSKNDVTSIKGYAKQIGYKFRSILDADAKADPKTLVENLLREIAVGSVEEILGQSSGRLSDKDIELATKLVSEIEGLSGAFTSENNIRSILVRRRSDLNDKVSTSQGEIDRILELFDKYNIKTPSLSYNPISSKKTQIVNIGLEEALELSKKN
jgi:hypothetical protein